MADRNSWLINLIGNKLNQKPGPHLYRQFIKAEKEERCKKILNSLEELFATVQKGLNEVNQENGVTNWLLVLTIVKNGFDLTKQQFWNSIRLQYDWVIANLPDICACYLTYTIKHSMFCKKARFFKIHSNDVRDLIAKSLSEVCYDVQVKPSLLSKTGQWIEHPTAINNNKARMDKGQSNF